MQRFTYYFAARKDLQQRLPEGPAYYLSRFYYDTANAMTIHPLASLTKDGGADADHFRDRETAS